MKGKNYIMKRRNYLIGALFATGIVFILYGFNTEKEDPLLQILKEELNREMAVLKKEKTPPYYMGYRVDDVNKIRIEASFGSLVKTDQKRERHLTVMARVGSHELDNFHEMRENYNAYWDSRRQYSKLPLTNEEKAVKQVLWRCTDKQYKKALDKYAQVKANVAVKVDEEDQSDDFSHEEAAAYYEPPAALEDFKFDKKEWEEKLKKCSKHFLEDTDIFFGRAGVTFGIERKYFISTEGTEVVHNRTYARVFLIGRIKAEDGMVLPVYRDFFAFSPEDLPDDATLENTVKEIVSLLSALKNAPVVEPYAGPALLSGEASGVFFHEIFGHRIEGHRLKSEYDAQTFKDKLGKEVLHSDLSVAMNPSMKSFNGQDLNGYYLYDDEGVKGSKVTVVEDGVLQGFLMSRSPIKRFKDSNGHGRAQAGYQPVSRQSNLIVTTSSPYSEEKLKKILLKEAKKQGLDYAYYFQEVTGGFTFTGRYMPNSFNVTPTVVYRVYVDGRPDELVRGVDLVGTPLAMFSKIEAAGDDYGVFTGTCGAESGGVPVSAVSPTLYVRQIELQKKHKSQNKPYVLERPDMPFNQENINNSYN